MPTFTSPRPRFAGAEASCPATQFALGSLGRHVSTPGHNRDPAVSESDRDGAGASPNGRNHRSAQVRLGKIGASRPVPPTAARSSPIVSWYSSSTFTDQTS
jgi:hypothetical protein